MITKEEFNNIEIGDKIKIVDEWNDFTRENSDGHMDYRLGHIFEVTNKATTTTVEKNDTYYNLKIIKMNSGYDYWFLNEFCIENVIKHNLKSITDASLEKMLEVSI